MAAGAEISGTLVSDIQADIVVSGDAITGTLHDLTEGDIVAEYGEGNFIALQLTDIDERATSVMMGMDDDLIEATSGVFKVTDKDTQEFVVRITDGTEVREDRYGLTGLTVEG